MILTHALLIESGYIINFCSLKDSFFLKNQNFFELLLFLLIGFSCQNLIKYCHSLQLIKCIFSLIVQMMMGSGLNVEN
jgi:hypothetical protein